MGPHRATSRRVWGLLKRSSGTVSCRLLARGALTLSGPLGQDGLVGDRRLYLTGAVAPDGAAAVDKASHLPAGFGLVAKCRGASSWNSSVEFQLSTALLDVEVFVALAGRVPVTISFTSPRLSRNSSLPEPLPRQPYVATTPLE